ncbi:MAG: sodium:proton antiporter [Myxococcales bacterium]|nr:sodium:proton antiporter [Myxococcales bacterium]
MVAAVALAIAAKRARVPYNVALVVGGLLIAVSGVLPTAPRMNPEVVLLLGLPALLYEGGITADLSGIRANAVPIALLSVLGMGLAIAVTGVAAHLALGLAFGPALLLAAILSVTDTVSILYVFRRAPLPSRLAGVILGESLFNDGTALVAYGAIATFVAGTAVSLPGIGVMAAVATAGGIAVGLALGLAAAVVLRRTGDPLADIMVTTALAFAAFTVGEGLHVSGAIASVTAGLTTAASLRQSLSPHSQVAIHSFWEYVAFGVNTFLFLSVGLSTNPASLLKHYPLILLALVCVFAGRSAGIYLPYLLLRLFGPVHWAPLRWQHAFVIGNIKGALSIALVLGLPAGAPSRELLIDVVFGVTFVSLVVQGPLLLASLRGLGLLRSDPVAAAIGEQQAVLITSQAARQELEGLHSAGLVPRDAYDHLRGEYQAAISVAERELRRLHDRHMAYGARLLLATRRRLIDAERTALAAARRAGLVPEETAARASQAIDARLLELDRILAEHRQREPGPAQRGEKA